MFFTLVAVNVMRPAIWQSLSANFDVSNSQSPVTSSANAGIAALSATVQPKIAASFVRRDLI